MEYSRDASHLVTIDLAIRHYPFKWKEAQRLARKKVEETGLTSQYWDYARQYFLELGGCYKWQVR